MSRNISVAINQDLFTIKKLKIVRMCHYVCVHISIFEKSNVTFCKRNVDFGKRRKLMQEEGGSQQLQLLNNIRFIWYYVAYV